MLYLTSIYWGFQIRTTVGYGDIEPKTEMEKIVAIIRMIGGAVFFSFMIGMLTSLLTCIDSNKNAMSQKIFNVNKFAKEAQLTK